MKSAVLQRRWVRNLWVVSINYESLETVLGSSKAESQHAQIYIIAHLATKIQPAGIPLESVKLSSIPFISVGDDTNVYVGAYTWLSAYTWEKRKIYLYRTLLTDTIFDRVGRLQVLWSLFSFIFYGWFHLTHELGEDAKYEHCLFELYLPIFSHPKCSDSLSTATQSSDILSVMKWFVRSKICKVCSKKQRGQQIYKLWWD